MPGHTSNGSLPGVGQGRSAAAGAMPVCTCPGPGLDWSRPRKGQCLFSGVGSCAHLPFHKTLEAFDFAFRPSIDERQVRELAQRAFVREAANVLLTPLPFFERFRGWIARVA
ncbi:MAG: ATP-binding protein [Firmicutes bacterium]|nr:ATP-binding protein [Bacillota bacterium]